MTTLQEDATHARRDDPQREDVPYRWPRGPELRVPKEVQLHLFWLGVSIVAALLAALVVGYMVTHTGCAGVGCAG